MKVHETIWVNPCNEMNIISLTHGTNECGVVQNLEIYHGYAKFMNLASCLTLEEPPIVFFRFSESLILMMT